MNGQLRTWAAIFTLLLALLAAYIKFDREVQAKPDEERVARLIDARVNAFSATFAEILRRLERIERQLDNLADRREKEYKNR